jgi:hypothetical protein
MAKRDLDYCTITSPVKGVIVDRRVNVGQTVVSNMSVSSVFLIAKDLKRTQVGASVNEADIRLADVGRPPARESNRLSLGRCSFGRALGPIGRNLHGNVPARCATACRQSTMAEQESKGDRQ